MSNGKKALALPSKAALAEYINSNPNKVGKRDIYRAFRVATEDRSELRALLRELHDDGAIERQTGKNFAAKGSLPSVTVIVITAQSDDGRLLAVPVAENMRQDAPKIFIRPEKQRGPALGEGDRLLAKLTKTANGYEAQMIRKLQDAPKRTLGIYTEIAGGGRILPTSRREKYDYLVAPADRNGARRGELVAAELIPGRNLGLRAAKVVERLGLVGDSRSVSLIALHEHGIPIEFSSAVRREAEAAVPANAENSPDFEARVDLRHLPFVTIDGPDARDFDDAVWAKPDDRDDNPGGFELCIAIADVAQYVRPGSALDLSARERGNSAYFPDRVVPMLPEHLSNDLCCLRPHEDRPALALRLRIDRRGNKLEHEFQRVIIHSAARLTYQQAQTAADGHPDDTCKSLMKDVIEPLYGAYNAVRMAALAREPLNLDLPEMKIILDDQGKVVTIQPHERLDAHRLIEEFMILANVCAAESLEDRRQPCMYRIHDEPDRERLRGLKEFLKPMGFTFSMGEVTRPALFNRILAKAADGDHAEAVNQTILRTQSKAVYSPENHGHFGLALAKYAHFTSPIRRYSDLLVHRALISGYGLGDGGLGAEESEQFEDIASHISMTERRAMIAERDSNDRYIAGYLSERAGAEFAGRIAGVARAGLFVRLDDSHGDGLVPMSRLQGDYYIFDEQQQVLIGEHTGYQYRLGDAVTVRLSEANKLTGGLILEMLDGPEDTDRQGRKSGQKHKGSKRGATKRGGTKRHSGKRRRN